MRVQGATSLLLQARRTAGPLKSKESGANPHAIPKETTKRKLRIARRRVVARVTATEATCPNLDGPTSELDSILGGRQL